MMILWASAALVLSLLLFWQSNRMRRTLRMPAGKVIYSDREDWMGVTDVLFDGVIGLAGKPDYVVRKGKAMIPVEVKTGRTPAQPHDGHIYQLAAYCLLVQRHYGRRPDYGIIQYPEQTYTVDFTEALEDSLLDLLVEMHRDEDIEEIPRSHEEHMRCRGCGYRAYCEQSLI